ncbi:ABC transporter permease [Saccharospirillum sp.]|uniref:ABC transporter permease n=1 Tax=Saccharospirillum sp. TaxID=2033801 RepID=UPI0034A03A27
MPYLVRRAGHSIILLLVVVTFVFLAGRMIGDPAIVMLGPSATDAALEQLRNNLGLNDPLLVQYFRFITDLLQGDMGVSFRYGFSQMPADQFMETSGTPVMELVLERLPQTFYLAAVALSSALVLALTLGCLGAMWPRSWVDNLVNVLSLASVSVVQFWLGLMLILLFAVHLGWLPTGGYGEWYHVILPAIALGARPLGRVGQVTRSAMLDELSRPYAAAARAKGLPEHRIVSVHALKNAGIPIVTITGDELVQLVTGAILVETVFGWPGIGQLLVSSMSTRDLPVLQGAILTVAALVIVVNLVVDATYTYLNPRVSFSSRSS